MKNKLIVSTVIIFFIGIFYIIDIEGLEDFSNSVCIKNVSTIDKEELKNIKKNREEAKYDLIEMEYKDQEIPYDKNKDVYYFYYNNNEYNFDVHYSEKTDIKVFSNKNKMLNIIAYNKHKYKTYKIIFSDLPIINISLDDKANKKELISEKESYGDITIFDYSLRYPIKQDSKIKIRGRSSKLYDKKSYTIKFIDSNSGKKISRNDILGLSSNCIYALDSLYEDESKIRDITSNKVWKEINKSNEQKFNIEYVEVIINNEYYGLYGFKDLINDYELGKNKDNSVLYKINSYNIAYKNNLEKDIKDSTEIVYSKKSKEESWGYLKELMNLVYYCNDEKFNKEILNYVDLDNFVDNFILMEAIYNFDGLLKNDVLQYNIDTGKFIKIPWDLDLTFGKVWNDNVPLKSSNDINLSKQLLANTGNDATSTYLEQRLWQNNVGNFSQKVAKRWKELRSGFLETESFVNYANSIYDEVTESGAREREHERWPDGGYSTDNNFIEKFIRQRLPYLDSQFLQYLDDSGEN
ncbi:MAG: CotH kinase family protein [Clostridiales bacterium]|nr:CotH kinase family protein [Clostridiales bacterium]